MREVKDYIYVGIQLILFILYLPDWKPLYLNYPEWLFWPGASFFIIGIMIGLVALLQLNKNLSPFPTPLEGGELIQNGVYRWIRHPIYTAILLAFTGYGLVQESVWKILVTVVLMVLFRYKARYEEGKLLEKYPEYGEYMKRTGRFLPKIGK